MSEKKKQTTLDNFTHLNQIAKRDNESLRIIGNYVSDSILNFHSEQVAEESNTTRRDILNAINIYAFLSFLNFCKSNTTRRDILNATVIEGVGWEITSYFDEKYPHQCFTEGCPREINYEHALIKYEEQVAPELKELGKTLDYPIDQHDLNARKIYFDFAILEHKTRKKFNKIWKNPIVQFYCCSCFRAKEKEKDKEKIIEKKRNRLLLKAKRLQEKFKTNINR